jgi:hypothetical protein
VEFLSYSLTSRDSQFLACQNVKRYADYYRLRQQIVEPNFGVWKRQWHFDHLTLKTKPKVEMEVSLAALTYNLMHVFKIKGQEWIEKMAKKSFFRLILIINFCDTQIRLTEKKINLAIFRTNRLHRVLKRAQTELL